MGYNDNDNQSLRSRYKASFIAVALAIVMTVLIAPEVMEGNSMEDTISDGQVIVMKKESYSNNRGLPELGEVVVMEKWVGEDYTSDNIVARVVALPGETVELEDGTEIKLEDEEVFILCDNEDSEDCVDSRTIGPVSVKDIRGYAFINVWPLNEISLVK